MLLYEKHYQKLEKIRWNLKDDVAWDTLRPDLITPAQVELVKNICMTEIGSLFATEAFLRDFNDNIDFSCFISVWYYEEMKHFMALKQYLSLLDVEIPEDRLQKLRMTVPESNQETILMIHFLSEHRLASWYLGLADWLEEPVGKDLFNKIAADEIRHGQAYFDYILLDLERRPERMLNYLKTAQFMLSPRAPLDLHAVTITGSVDLVDDPKYILNMDPHIFTEERKQAALTRMYSLVSHIAKETIEDYPTLSKFVKQLKRSLPPELDTVTVEEIEAVAAVC